MIKIVTYSDINGVLFGEHLDSVLDALGTPNIRRKNRGGQTVLHYEECMMLFDSATQEFRECLVPYGVPVMLNSQPIEWNPQGFRGLFEMDGEPFETNGIVILFNLGIATEYPDNDKDEQSITAFRKGVWDDWKAKMKRFEG